MERELIMAALMGLCANPKHAGEAPGKLGARAVAIVKGVVSKLDREEDPAPSSPSRASDIERMATAPEPPADPDGPKVGAVELHQARHPHT